LKSAIELTLRISAFRYHAGLHSNKKHNRASVLFDGQLVQELFTDSRMPNGIDYGFDREITCRLNLVNVDATKPEHTVRLEVAEASLWDVDEIRVELTTKRKRVREWVLVLSSLVAGTLLDAAFGKSLQDWFALVWKVVQHLGSCR